MKKTLNPQQKTYPVQPLPLAHAMRAETQAQDAELTRLRAEVSRLNGIVGDMCNESRELRAALATERRAVERLAGAVGDMSFAEPGAGCPDGVSRCLMENTAPDCAACWAAWARQEEVPNVE